MFLLGFHPSYIVKDFGDLVLPDPLYELIPLGPGNLLGDCQFLHSFCCLGLGLLVELVEV